jgi:hypothetical protein
MVTRDKLQRHWSTGLFWAVLITACLVFGAMRVWVPQVIHEDEPLPTFDARIGGYDLVAAETYLKALSEAEKRKYLDVVQRLDIAFPLLLAVAVGWSILRLTPIGWGRARYLLPLVAVPAMVSDYVENLAVTGLLISNPANLSPDLVRFASRATQTKFAFLALEFIVIAVLVTMFVYRRWTIRKP